MTATDFTRTKLVHGHYCQSSSDGSGTRSQNTFFANIFKVRLCNIKVNKRKHINVKYCECTACRSILYYKYSQLGNLYIHPKPCFRLLFTLVRNLVVGGGGGSRTSILPRSAALGQTDGLIFMPPALFCDVALSLPLAIRNFLHFRTQHSYIIHTSRLMGIKLIFCF